MSAVVIPIRPRQNVVMVQPAKGGFEITLVKVDGRRTYLGTSPNLGAARNVAHAEAFRVGRCRVQLLGEGGRA